MTTKAENYFLTIGGNGNLDIYAGEDLDLSSPLYSVGSIAEFDELVYGPLNGLSNFGCSSSMDFPEEYTSNKEVLMIVEHINKYWI